MSGRLRLVVSVLLGGIMGACGPGGEGAGHGYDGACPDDVDCSVDGTALAFRVRSDRMSFFNRPWPADARLTGEGTIDLAGFPNPGASSLLADWLEVVERTTRGFGTSSAVYLVFDGPLDPGSLPGAAATLAGPSPVMLVDVSGGPGHGERIPLRLRFFEERRQFTPPNTLVLRPVEGFALRASTRYAAVVTRGLADASGRLLGAEADFERTKYRVPPDDERLRAWWESMQPAYDALEELGLCERSEVAALAVYTTQPVLAEMDAVRAFVAGRPVPQVRRWAALTDGERVHRFEGWFELPEFQLGDPPDFEGGGGFVFDAEGRPVPRRTVEIPFTLAVPRGAPPGAGWPIVLYAHGTGGTRNGFCNAGGDPCELMAEDGIASIGIDQPMHGDREPPGGADPTAATFNVTNLEAFRDNFRQGAADLLVLRRVVETLEVPAEVAPGGAAIAIDAGRVGFMGHSQGGITGSIFLGSAVDIQGAVLSAAGGGLNLVILERKDPFDIGALVVASMGLEEDEFDIDHPVLNVFQAFAERADPINYARRFVAEPPAGTAPTHLFFSEGMHDQMTMPRQIENLAAASGCSLMTPLAREVEAMQLRGREPQAPPVSGNAEGPGGEPVTCVLVQYPDEDHFAVFYNPDAKRHYTGFLDTLMHQPLPAVGP